MRHLLADLTDPQRAAVTHVEGPLLVLAGPGSGKTRVVTHRIAHLLAEGVSERQILALTFTNKAADEMRSRLAELAPGARVWLSTFHRFCARVLREFAPLVGLEPNFTIYDADDSLRLWKRVLEADDRGPMRFRPEQLATLVSRAKNKLLTPERFAEGASDPLSVVAARLYPDYQAALLRANAVDFDDLLLHVAELLTHHEEVRAPLDARHQFLLVDEYQDTNQAQYRIVRALAVDHPHLAVTGDPDQSIYGWRGANIGNILDFERDYPGYKTVRLEQNFRSTGQILRVADVLIAQNRRRKPKSLFTENPPGPPVRLTSYATSRDEAEAIAGHVAAAVRSGRRRPADFALFYRINALSRAFETALRELGVPYQIVSGLEFYQRQEIKDLLAYLRVINNPRDDLALARIVNVPPRGIGKTTLGRLQQHAAERGWPLGEAARQCGLVPGVAKRSAIPVARFMALLDRLGELATGPVEPLLRAVVADTGYQLHLQESELPEDQERLANIQELLTAARQFDEVHPEPGALEGFLEQACLVNDQDGWDAVDDRVTLMTLHAAKGLEFPVVFVVALEEGLLPHERASDSEAGLEEERRLLFVGITRARQELYLSRAERREFRGQTRFTVPSTFLQEMPLDEMEVELLSPRSDSWEPAATDVHPPEADEFEFPAPPPRSTLTAGAAIARDQPRAGWQTAAELVSSPERRPRTPPEAFREGMWVRHPEYGQGQVVQLSGSSTLRCATVRFDSTGEKKFILVHSVLEPVE